MLITYYSITGLIQKFFIPGKSNQRKHNVRKQVLLNVFPCVYIEVTWKKPVMGSKAKIT